MDCQHCANREKENWRFNAVQAKLKYSGIAGDIAFDLHRDEMGLPLRHLGRSYNPDFSIIENDSETTENSLES